MAPPKRPWFRFYTEAVTDPKLRRLSVEERWLWVVVLAAARASGLPGWLMLTESLPLSNDDLAEQAGMTPAKVERGVAKMVELHLLTYDGDIGAYRVTKWDERQFESDDTTKRTAKHRSKNGDATPMERPNAVDVAPPESEADTETDPSSSSVTASTPTLTEDDDEVLTILAGLRLASRKAPDVVARKGPVSNDGMWTTRAKRRDSYDGALLVKLDATRAEHPGWSPEALARYLFDGTEPPKPPAERVCGCGFTTTDFEAWQDHMGDCYWQDPSFIPASEVR